MNNSKSKLPNDPITGISIEQLGEQLKNSSINCLELTSNYYKRIKILNTFLLRTYIYLNKVKVLSREMGKISSSTVPATSFF